MKKKTSIKQYILSFFTLMCFCTSFNLYAQDHLTTSKLQALDQYKKSKIKFIKQRAIFDAYSNRLEAILQIEDDYGRRAPKTKNFLEHNISNLRIKIIETERELYDQQVELEENSISQYQYQLATIPSEQQDQFTSFLLSIHRLDLEGTTVWKELFNLTDRCSLNNLSNSHFSDFLGDKVSQLIDLTDNMGVGINYSLGASFLGGAELHAMLEMINFNNQLTLYCSAGAGVTLGAEANASSLTGSVIRTFGCGGSKNYRGGFLSVSASVSYGVSVKGQISFGVKAMDLYRHLTNPDFLKEIYGEKVDINKKRIEVIKLFKDFLIEAGSYTFKKYFKNVSDEGQLKGTLNLIKDEILNRDILKHVIHEYLDYLRQSSELSTYPHQQRIGQALLKQLGGAHRILFTGCNAISVEIGAGVSAGATGGINYSHYIDVNERGIDLEKIKNLSRQTSRRLTGMICDPSFYNLKRAFLFLGKQYLKIGYKEIKEFSKAVANAPYRCSGLKHLVEEISEHFQIKQSNNN